MLNRSKIVVLSWNPGDSCFQTAGGFKRAYEIVRRCPNDIRITCIDRSPTYFDKVPANVIVDTYHIPKLITSITGIHFVVGKTFEKIYVAFLLFLKLLLKYRSYVIYVPYSELSQLTLPAICCRILLGSRVVLCNLNVNKFFPETFLNPLLHHFASLTITISHDLQKDLARHHIRAEVINPVGIDLLLPSKIPEQEKVYDSIYIGRHTPEKGIIDAIKICALLNKTKPFTLVTVGMIPQNYVDEITVLIAKEHLQDKITLRGVVSEEEKLILLKQSRLCIFPSHQEGWAIVPQEALACGIPVVAYNLSVYQENIAACPAVHLVEENNYLEFVQSVQATLDLASTEINGKISKSLFHLQNFSWDTVSNKEYIYITGEYAG